MYFKGLKLKSKDWSLCGRAWSDIRRKEFSVDMIQKPEIIVPNSDNGEMSIRMENTTTDPRLPSSKHQTRNCASGS